VDNSNSQTLIIEFEGPESKIQELLEKLEKSIDADPNLEIKAVTIRKN
jgi:hypothetical protein